METKTVLVTGTGGNVGQGVLRNIRDLKHNIRIVGTDIARFTAGNHLCDATYAVPYSYDPGYVGAISTIISAENVDLVIPTTDYEVYYLSLNRDTLGATVAASDAELAKIYLDKYLSFQHHQKHGIPFAPSWLPKDYDGPASGIIVKPREGRGSRGLHIDPAAPRDFSDEYMVQPLLRGREITTAFYVTRQGHLHGHFTMERELTNGATSKSVVTRAYDAEIEKILLKMLAVKGLRGSVNLQSMVSDSGEIMPFEVNCRISGTNSIRHNLGFRDVAYTLQEHLYGEDPEPVRPIDGIAIRLLTDVIYPGMTDENALTDNTSKFIVY